MSDELGMFAHPRRAIHHTSEDALISAVADVIVEEGVEGVVVGLPLSLSGVESEQTRQARAFMKLLRQCLSVPIIPWDERLSTREAGHYVSGRSARRSGDQDSMAAAIILQAVLDSRRGVSA